MTNEQRLKQSTTMLDHERKINLERFDVTKYEKILFSADDFYSI